MKKTVSLILAALLLCVLLLAACGEDAQKDVPAGDLPAETPEPAGLSDPDDSPSVKREDLPGLTTEGGDNPPPAEPDAPDAEPDQPDAAPGKPDAEPGKSGVEPDESATEPDRPAATPGEPAKEPDQPAMGPDQSLAAPSSARLGETADAGREYLDKLIFLGDSTTYGIGYYYDHGYADLVPPSQVWTPASGTLTLSYYATATIVYPETGEEIFIRDAVERAKPEYLVITLGVNGISFMDKDWFIRDYTALVEMVKDASPDTKIILNSIYPVCASYPHQKDINNDRIRAANGWIEQIAVDTGARFLYSFESVVGEDGYLPQASTNGDGLHLTGEAFTRVMAYIRTHAYS